MATISTELAAVGRAVTAALDAARSDPGASPVTVAVLAEFAAKSEKALGAANHDAVIELEQAGDSAKAAAEADKGVASKTRQLTLDAHLAICMLKANTAAPSPRKG